MVEMKSYKTANEWLRARKSYIGGSDVSSIMGCNKYRNNIDLYLEKTGQRKKAFVTNPAIEYGKAAEQYLRELFKLDYPQYKVEFVDNNIWTNTNYPFAHASLDGWMTDKETHKKGILEIKTTEIRNKLMSEEWHNQIPDQYYCQILHYLLVTEFEFVIVKAQLKYNYDDLYLKTLHFRIDRKDVLDDIEYLKQQEIKFFEYLKNKEVPPLVLPNL